ncbi:MAG: hypothetical protein IT429_19050 [Gemmataceae bacterium]|nr:hypothetical protein [Gemmataceae bacterium]
MSWRVYLLGVGLILVALAGVVTDQILGMQPGVSERNVRRICPGMTHEEVETLLGGPADSTVTVGLRPMRCGSDFVAMYRAQQVQRWVRGHGTARVAFGLLDGRVRSANYSAEEGITPFTRFRSWVGW